MLLTEAIRAFNTIKKGAYTKLIYSTEVPVKAAYKDNVKITKFCVTTGRFGINYGNLASVKNREEDRTKTYKKNLNKEWILRNIIEYNKNTDKFYLNVYGTPNKSKYVYILTEGNKTRILNNLNTVKEYIQNSYFTKKCDSPTKFYKINLTNVHRIGNATIA